MTTFEQTLVNEISTLPESRRITAREFLNQFESNG